MMALSCRLWMASDTAGRSPAGASFACWTSAPVASPITASQAHRKRAIRDRRDAPRHGVQDRPEERPTGDELNAGFDQAGDVPRPPPIVAAAVHKCIGSGTRHPDFVLSANASLGSPRVRAIFRRQEHHGPDGRSFGRVDGERDSGGALVHGKVDGHTGATVAESEEKVSCRPQRFQRPEPRRRSCSRLRFGRPRRRPTCMRPRIGIWASGAPWFEVVVRPLS